MIYPYKSLLVQGTLKEEGNSDTYDNKTDLEDIMISEVSSHKRTNIVGLHFIEGVQNSQIPRDRKERGGFQGLVGREDGQLMLMGRLPAGHDEGFWR